MDVGIGLPNAVPGTTGRELLAWARRAEERGFSSLGAIDRIVHSNYEPLVALAAVAAVTERIKLCTSVLLAPLRGNAAILAKQAMSVNAISGGRLTLGVGLGGREDDFEYSGLHTRGLGARLDAILEKTRSTWADEQIGPRLSTPPQILVGGSRDASFRRAARFGDGWIDGVSTVDEFADMADKVRAEWTSSGREGNPRITALSFFSLGAGSAETVATYVAHFYGSLGEEVVTGMREAAATDVPTIQGHISGFQGAGCDELIFFPASNDLLQVDLLADACELSALVS